MSKTEFKRYKVRSGDIYKVILSNGSFAYLQYVKRMKFPYEADVLRVIGLDNSICDRLESLAEMPTKFHVLAGVKVLLEDTRFTFVGHAALRVSDVPPFKMGLGTSWTVAVGTEMRPGSDFTSEELDSMPIIVFVSVDGIVRRVELDWKDGREELSFLGVGTTKVPLTISVFLDFHDEARAKMAASQFGTRGFKASFKKLSKIMGTWELKATLAAVETDLDTVLRIAEDIAQTFDGTVTGNEVG